MPLQNRVTPFGELVAIPERGLVMGNRGVLHDDVRRIVRDWQLRRWIICLTEFRGRYRSVMQPRRYTELFFLDEATALAAGHRPCAECRNADYRKFVELWTAANAFASEAGADTRVRADAIDLQLHEERLVRSHVARNVKRVYRAELHDLPDGAFVRVDERAWLVLGNELLLWSPQGYGERRKRTTQGNVDVLTPPSTFAVLAAGYIAGLHPSAG